MHYITNHKLLGANFLPVAREFVRERFGVSQAQPFEQALASLSDEQLGLLVEFFGEYMQSERAVNALAWTMCDEAPAQRLRMPGTPA